MKFTILGGSGFIGNCLGVYLKQKGYEVDLVGREQIKNLNQYLGCVIYCVGVTANFREQPLATVEAHICLLKDILENKEFDSLTYLSSTRVYESAQNTSESEVIKVSPFINSHLYNLSKLMGESLCLHASEKARVIRLSNVFGEMMPASTFLSSIITEAKIKKEVVFLTSPDSEKDFISILDVVRGIERIALSGLAKKIYNVASGSNISNLEISKILEKNKIRCRFADDTRLWKFPKIQTDILENEIGFTVKGTRNKLEKYMEKELQDIN